LSVTSFLIIFSRSSLFIDGNLQSPLVIMVQSKASVGSGPVFEND
jgi:hypothetical protein